MHKYFIVVGLRDEFSDILESAKSAIDTAFYIDAYSKTYFAESEDARFSGSYINYAFQISSFLDIDALKHHTQQLEQQFYKNNKKAVDLDIILQIKNSELLFIDNTFYTYCHILKTLNDIIPDHIIDSVPISTHLQNHKNNKMFVEYAKVLV